MRHKVLKIYQDKFGNEPFIDWLDSIKDKVTKNRIIAQLDRLEVGNYGDYKPVGNGVLELRLQFDSAYRIYFTEINDVIVLLLIGGDKSSQSKDIQKAIEFWERHKEISK